MKSFWNLAGDFISGQEHIRIALIGSKESGKTVFLTALLNHLRYPNKKRLDLGGGWEIARSEVLSGPKDFPAFRYGDARSSLSKGEWPDNTTKVSLVRQKLTLKNEKRRRKTVVLEILDLPGERIADLSMVGCSFEEWSGWMDEWLGGVNGASEHFKEYKRKCIEEASNANEISSFYKDCVASQYKDGIMTITPSVLKLGVNGEYHGGVSAEVFRKNIESVCIGVDETCGPFAPLPQDYFNGGSKQRRGIVKAFERAYDKYRKRVERIAEWLVHANKAVYLVDVLSLLRRGPEAYNAEREFASQALRLFGQVSSDSRIFGPMQRFFQRLGRTHADEVYVLATKADMVVGEANRSHMKDLAQAMLESTLRNLDGMVACEVLSCASVRTSEEYRAEKGLEARVLTGKDNEGKPLVEAKTYEVSDVPEEWPDSRDWKPGDKRFDFRPTFPRFDTKQDTPPLQLGLEAVVQRLLSLQKK